jgi:hypothetical protein
VPTTASIARMQSSNLSRNSDMERSPFSTRDGLGVVD